MARRGRPKKTLNPIDIEKNELTDTIVDQVKYNCKLTDEQIFYLRRTLDDTLKGYDLEKVRTSDEGKSIKDINAEAVQDFLNSKKAEAKSKTTIYNYDNELGKLFLVINKDYRDITSQVVTFSTTIFILVYADISSFFLVIKIRVLESTA